MSVLDDVINQLELSLVSGGVTGWESKKSFMPPSPDKVVSVFDVGGRIADQTQGIHQFDEISFQVRVRSISFDYESAAIKINTVFTALNNITLSGYIFIFADSIQPIPLGLDSNNRPELVMNFSGMKTR